MNEVVLRLIRRPGVKKYGENEDTREVTVYDFQTIIKAHFKAIA